VRARSQARARALRWSLAGFAVAVVALLALLAIALFAIGSREVPLEKVAIVPSPPEVRSEPRADPAPANEVDRPIWAKGLIRRPRPEKPGEEPGEADRAGLPEPARTYGAGHELRRNSTLDHQIQRELEAHALSGADLEHIPALAGAVRAVEDARRTKDQEVLRRAQATLAAALSSLPRDIEALRAKLLSAKELLQATQGEIPSEKLPALEKRYLDLRAALRPDLSPLERARLAGEVDALARAIGTAGRSAR
jgi:hypothetical protein